MNNFDTGSRVRPMALEFRVFGIRYFKTTVHGGPYRMRPAFATVGVNMAAEIDDPAEIRIPTKDFSTPKESDLHNGLCGIIDALAVNERVYIGCMGGIGRTGLTLACLAKIAGERDPVGYVRAHYLSHAVETKPQQMIVSALAVGHFRRRMLRKRAWAVLTGKRRRY